LEGKPWGCPKRRRTTAQFRSALSLLSAFPSDGPRCGCSARSPADESPLQPTDEHAADKIASGRTRAPRRQSMHHENATFTPLPGAAKLRRGGSGVRSRRSLRAGQAKAGAEGDLVSLRTLTSRRAGCTVSTCPPSARKAGHVDSLKMLLRRQSSDLRSNNSQEGSPPGAPRSVTTRTRSSGTRIAAMQTCEHPELRASSSLWSGLSAAASRTQEALPAERVVIVPGGARQAAAE
jgi:hypothetical protein